MSTIDTVLVQMLLFCKVRTRCQRSARPQIPQLERTFSSSNLLAGSIVYLLTIQPILLYLSVGTVQRGMNMNLGHRPSFSARFASLAGLIFLLCAFILSREYVPYAFASQANVPPIRHNKFQSSSTSTPSITPSKTADPTHSLTPSSTVSETIMPSQTPPPTPAHTPSETLSPTLTATSTQDQTPTPSETPTATLTRTPETIPPATPYPLRTILINELAWAGTIASANDEWIELFNTSNDAINLNGWTLTDGGDIRINLQGTISPRGYFLLERTDNSTIVDISANQIYRGNLRNSGETLRLTDPSGSLVDSANGGGGPWPAGDAASRKSMEREGQGGNWGTYSGVGGFGHDANGTPIQGTPTRRNSVLLSAPTPTYVPHATPTPSPPPSSSPTPNAPQTLLINEIAWSGTIASSSDEWIELYNPGGITMSLEGWVLTDAGDIEISLMGHVPARGYFLLERSDDSAITDLQADQIYVGGLNNSGETLLLIDPSGAIVDSANSKGGAWPAGSSRSHASMEREGGADLGGNWETFTGYFGVGHDADGNPIQGTPRSHNSILQPTPAPTWIPGTIRINEVLIKPHYDWEGKGGVDTGDEFIELINIGPKAVFLKGWYLDDLPDSGSKPFKIPGITLKPGSMMAFFHTRTHITLNDSGDTIRVLSPNGTVVDEVTYLKTSAYNLSYGRLPDGSGTLKYGLWPTPNEPNILYEEPFIPANTGLPIKCPNPGQPVTFLMRHVRHPAQTRWMRANGYAICG